MLAYYLTDEHFSYLIFPRRVKHIFNENCITFCRVVDEDVSYRADELSILNYGTARHDCCQWGTTFFLVFEKMRRIMRLIMILMMLM